MSKTYNHAFYLGFTVDSDNEDFPTEREILHAMTARLTEILDPTPHPSSDGNLRHLMMQELDGPYSTLVNN